jgi:hypothetical protein
MGRFGRYMGLGGHGGHQAAQDGPLALDPLPPCPVSRYLGLLLSAVTVRTSLISLRGRRPGVAPFEAGIVGRKAALTRRSSRCRFPTGEVTLVESDPAYTAGPRPPRGDNPHRYSFGRLRPLLEPNQAHWGWVVPRLKRGATTVSPPVRQGPSFTTPRRHGPYLSRLAVPSRAPGCADHADHLRGRPGPPLPGSVAPPAPGHDLVTTPPGPGGAWLVHVLSRIIEMNQYLERRRDHVHESAVEPRRLIGDLLDMKPGASSSRSARRPWARGNRKNTRSEVTTRAPLSSAGSGPPPYR